MRTLRSGRAGAVAAALLWAGLALSGPAHAAAPDDARSATAFVRVLGRVSTEVTRAWTERHEGEETLLATGTAFAVSPDGLLLTSRHVVEGLELVRERLGERVEVIHEVTRVEVLLPGRAGPRVFAARVVAGNPENDLALLSVPAVELPWLRLGDTDALLQGDALRALGFPRGAAVEVARRDVVLPEASESRGRVTALRRDDAGVVRYLQLDAALNPGNSGGPVLDPLGYVAGLVRMRLRDSNGLGFAVATGPIKDFLAAHAGEPVLRERLSPGPRQSLAGKRLSLALPEGFADEAPERVRVSAAGTELRLEIDRVISDWDLEALGSSVAGGGFDGLDATPALAPRRDRDRLSGTTTARTAGAPLGVEYTVLGVAGEALIARWIGDADAVAFNRGALRRSLASLEAEALVDPAVPLSVRLEVARLRGGPQPPPWLPAGWLDEAAPQAPCPELRPPDTGRAARWPGDFRVALRALWWREARHTAEEAARRCSARASGLGEGSWSLQGDRLGSLYLREGLFIEREGGLLLLEVQTPVEHAEAVRPVAAEWIRAHLRP
jgi:S1-C subfamily serine protease